MNIVKALTAITLKKFHSEKTFNMCLVSYFKKDLKKVLTSDTDNDILVLQVKAIWSNG